MGMKIHFKTRDLILGPGRIFIYLGPICRYDLMLGLSIPDGIDEVAKEYRKS